MQKVCFSDREKFSETLPPPSKIGKLNTTLSMNRVGKLSTTLSYGSRWKTQHNAFLWVALENSTQRSLLCFLCQSLPQFYYIRPY
ncbi:hypothetical protein LEP1GSC124_3706 [Leptospira interrogans serovar Pyrogenes str. 200701872]|uniref:Uncharacterized protein n=1 Tax=Leptospira interrogans serovar Pyrogenes str. 200701872 TaxID=1193029 RepID=M7A519_LEPIR|nr:hypothetical protein LEP1GSC124_3706 [Leptospira interrogans serovar Pyrogenes str. 200701872]